MPGIDTISINGFKSIASIEDLKLGAINVIIGPDGSGKSNFIHLKEDASCLFTTMVDYYGMPQEGEKAWPGRAEANRKDFPSKAVTVQDALRADIGKDFDSTRFKPYVIMHEFEGLLFSDCNRFAEGIGQPTLAPQFQAIRKQFNTPEEINDLPVTAPSKRVKALFPYYQKPLFGRLAVLKIGLNTIRAECLHFRQWLEYLEGWPGKSG